MANAIYPLWKQGVMSGTAGYELTNATATNHPYASLVNTGVYTYAITHAFRDVSLTGTAGTDQEITSPAVSTAGTFSGGNVTFTAVAGVVTYSAIVVHRHNTAVTNMPLVMYYDVAGGNLPVTSNGGNITITWSGSGIFTL